MGLSRQRQTLRLVQVLLVIIAAGLLMFAGYSLGRRSGFDAARAAQDLGAPRRPPVAQTIVLALLGTGALVGAVALQGPGGVKVLTPALLEEVASQQG